MNTPSLIEAHIAKQDARIRELETLIHDIEPIANTALRAEAARVRHIDHPEFADDYIRAGLAHQDAIRKFVEKGKGK